MWIDCEMTGLELGHDRLIEIACVVTDADLHLLDDGIDLVISAPDDALDHMVDVVAEMHAASGLTEIIEDVNADPRYLACFATTRSEIVVPIFDGGEVVGEIDIDGSEPGAFDDTDRQFLEEVAALLAPLRPRP